MLVTDGAGTGALMSLGDGAHAKTARAPWRTNRFHIIGRTMSKAPEPAIPA